MYRFDGIRFRLTFSLAILLVVWSFSACDDTPVVGGNLSSEDTRVKADTINLNKLSTVGSPAFSGNLPYITAGSVEDPVFGDIKAKALLRPSISRQQEDIISDHSVADLILKIDHIYGAPEEPVEFHIVEIERRWRSSSWRYDSIPDLSHNVVGRFSVTGADSLVVRLDDDWTGRYREIFLIGDDAVRDSLYRAEMPGLAIVSADDHGKLVSVDAFDAMISFSSDAGEVEMEKFMSGWAVSLDANIPDNINRGTSIPVLNTMAAMIELDYEFTADFLGSSSFSRVEMVLYEDVARMDTGDTLQFVRPRSQTMRIFNLQREDLNFAIESEPRFQVNRRDEDGSFRINLTGLAQDQLRAGSGSTQRLYSVVGFNDGRVLPMLLHGPDDPERQPRLLITHIVQE